MASINKYSRNDMLVQFYETSVLCEGKTYYLVQGGKMNLKKLRELVKVLYTEGEKAGRNQLRATLHNILVEET